MNDRPIVTIPANLDEKLKNWAADRVAYFRGNGTARQAMPWTHEQFSDAECRLWLATRKVAADKIDPETCEMAWWYVNEPDEYGIREWLGELPEELIGASINRWNFVRSPNSDGWVSKADLPPEKIKALDDRIEREWQARRNDPANADDFIPPF